MSIVGFSIFIHVARSVTVSKNIENQGLEDERAIQEVFVNGWRAYYRDWSISSDGFSANAPRSDSFMGGSAVITLGVDGSPGTNFYNGSLDNIRFYDRGLTLEEAQSLHQSEIDMGSGDNVVCGSNCQFEWLSG